MCSYFACFNHFLAPKVSDVTENSCSVEWMAVKPIGEDKMSYRLQLGSKDPEFHVVSSSYFFIVMYRFFFFFYV